MTDKMKFENQAAQGDVMLWKRVQELPDDATPVDLVNGRLVVAHSETGHHHVLVVEPGAAVVYKTTKDPFVKYALSIKVPEGVMLKHERQADGHKTITFKSGGIYEIRRQREWSPEGWREVAD